MQKILYQNGYGKLEKLCGNFGNGGAAPLFNLPFQSYPLFLTTPAAKGGGGLKIVLQGGSGDLWFFMVIPRVLIWLVCASPGTSQPLETPAACVSLPIEISTSRANACPGFLSFFFSFTHWNASPHVHLFSAASINHLIRFIQVAGGQSSRQGHKSQAAACQSIQHRVNPIRVLLGFLPMVWRPGMPIIAVPMCEGIGIVQPILEKIMIINTAKKTISASFSELRGMGYPADILTVSICNNGEVYYKTPPQTTDLRATRPWSFEATDDRQKEPLMGLPVGEYAIKTTGF